MNKDNAEQNSRSQPDEKAPKRTLSVERSMFAGDGGHFWYRKGRSIVAVDEEGRERDVCLITNRADREDFEANADLLLAAPELPELLEVCRQLLPIAELASFYLPGELAENTEQVLSSIAQAKEVLNHYALKGHSFD